MPAARARRRRFRPGRGRLGWKPVLLETLFLLTGALLALAADEWREARNDRRRAETALAGIREELALSRAAVRQSLDYHVQLMDTLQHVLRAGPAPGALPDARLFSRGFVQPASLLHTAWETAGATDAVSHLPYEDVLAMARMYEQQRSYEKQAEQVGQLIYGKLFSEGYAGMAGNTANMLSIISTFWYRECQLAAAYDGVLAQIDRPPADDAVPDRCPAPR